MSGFPSIVDVHRKIGTDGEQRLLLQRASPMLAAMQMKRDGGLEFLQTDVNNHEMEDRGNSATQEPEAGFIFTTNKKSPGGGLKALNRFSGTGSRNCFFTPIQCMIQHDLSKYKKLVDSDVRLHLSG